ncbi:hypothetical protein M8818_004418 [Zalaria obscura]|uniref:Uncharacterized protein n=1 Tax=Zalaria obscura TaxID=2024903 RepID=A0ACC3SFG1_9PEZI
MTKAETAPSLGPNHSPTKAGPRLEEVGTARRVQRPVRVRVEPLDLMHPCRDKKGLCITLRLDVVTLQGDCISLSTFALHHLGLAGVGSHLIAPSDVLANSLAAELLRATISPSRWEDFGNNVFGLDLLDGPTRHGHPRHRHRFQA